MDYSEETERGIDRGKIHVCERCGEVITSGIYIRDHLYCKACALDDAIDKLYRADIDTIADFVAGDVWEE